MKIRRSKESYLSTDPEKRARSLENLNRSKTALKTKTPFLKDSRNKDLRYFLENHYILESGKMILLEDFQIKNFVEPISSGQFEIFIFGTPKKNGKSTLSAGLGIHQLFFSEAVSPEVYSLASSKDQAKIIFEKAKKAIRRSPELRKAAKIYKDRIETPFNDGLYQVLSADEDTAEGKNPSCILLDEGGVARWPLWISLLTAQAQRAGTNQHPIALITMTAGHDPASPFHKLVQRAQRGKEPGTFIFWTNDNPASWISPRWLAKQRKRLTPSEYARYHQNRWVSGSSSFVTQEDINRCIDPSLSPQGIGKSHRYYVALDLGLVKDLAVLTIVHREGYLTILDQIRTWQGKKDSPVLIDNLELELDKIYRLFNAPGFTIDSWQAAQLCQRLSAKGYRVNEIKFTTAYIQELSSNLYSIIHNSLLKFWKDEALITELLSVEAKQQASGIRIDHKSGGYSDRVISLGMSCLEASRESYFEGRPRVLLGDKFGQKRSALDREIDNMRINEPGRLSSIPAFWKDFKEIEKNKAIGSNIYPEGADEESFDFERRR